MIQNPEFKVILSYTVSLTLVRAKRFLRGNKIKVRREQTREEKGKVRFTIYESGKGFDSRM